MSLSVKKCWSVKEITKNPKDFFSPLYINTSVQMKNSDTKKANNDIKYTFPKSVLFLL